MTYTKRYEEARLSRWTAHRAVALTIGMGETTEALSRIVISNAPDGSPRARAPGEADLSISSTDRAGWAVTAVARDPEPIGCDLEIVEPRSTAFVRDYFTEREQRFIVQRSAPPELLANLIWSAKESALKVLRTGLRWDTRRVDVHLGSGEEEGWRQLTATIDSGQVLPGWWRQFGPFLLTLVTTVEQRPPTSLVEPSPLETARPIHSWVARPRRASGPIADASTGLRQTDNKA